MKPVEAPAKVEKAKEKQASKQTTRSTKASKPVLTREVVVAVEISPPRIPSNTYKQVSFKAKPKAKAPKFRVPSSDDNFNAFSPQVVEKVKKAASKVVTPSRIPTVSFLTLIIEITICASPEITS